MRGEISGMSWKVRRVSELAGRTQGAAKSVGREEENGKCNCRYIPKKCGMSALGYEEAEVRL